MPSELVEDLTFTLLSERLGDIWGTELKTVREDYRLRYLIFRESPLRPSFDCIAYPSRLHPVLGWVQDYQIQVVKNATSFESASKWANIHFKSLPR